MSKKFVYIQWDVFADTNAEYESYVKINTEWGRYGMQYAHNVLENKNVFKSYLQTSWLKAGALQAHGLYLRIQNPRSLRAWSSAVHESSYFSVDVADLLKASFFLSYGGISAWYWQRNSADIIGIDALVSLPHGFSLQTLALASYPKIAESDSWFYEYGGKRISLFHFASSLAYKSKLLNIISDLYMSMGELSPPRIQSKMYAKIHANIFTVKLLAGYSQERYRMPGGIMYSGKWQGSMETLFRISIVSFRYRFSWEQHYESVYHDVVYNRVGEHAAMVKIEHAARRASMLFYTAEIEMLNPSYFDVESSVQLRLLTWRIRAEAAWAIEKENTDYELVEQRYKIELRWAKSGYEFSTSISTLHEDAKNGWKLRAKTSFRIPFHANIAFLCSIESSDDIELEKAHWGENDQGWQHIYAQIGLSFAIAQH